MFVTLLVTVCLNLGVPGSCVTEPVVNSNQEQVTMTGCLGLVGFESAKEFWEHHPLFITTGNSRGGHAKSVITPRLSMEKFNDSKSLCRFSLRVLR
jgi:hypothetical protein